MQAYRYGTIRSLPNTTNPSITHDIALNLYSAQLTRLEVGGVVVVVRGRGGDGEIVGVTPLCGAV